MRPFRGGSIYALNTKIFKALTILFVYTLLCTLRFLYVCRSFS